jgi:phosphatidylglycerol---prolipoprotein diacylglyceryl transferase
MISYIIWDIDPRIFGGIEFLRWYGCCWAMGMMAAYQVMLKIYKREGLAEPDLDKLTTYVVLGVILGARFGHILFYDPVYYLNNPIEILPHTHRADIRIYRIHGVSKPRRGFRCFIGLTSV